MVTRKTKPTLDLSGMGATDDSEAPTMRTMQDDGGGDLTREFAHSEDAPIFLDIFDPNMMHWDNGKPVCGRGNERCLDWERIFEAIEVDPRLHHDVEKLAHRFLVRMRRTYARRVKRLVRRAERRLQVKDLEVAVTIHEGGVRLMLARHPHDMGAATNGQHH